MGVAKDRLFSYFVPFIFLYYQEYRQFFIFNKLLIFVLSSSVLPFSFFFLFYFQENAS